MARSTSLTEAEAGITCFASSLPGFRGVLKHRYSDFIVHEVARDGSVARLTSFDLPDECVDVSEEDKAAPSADADHSQALESFRALCGDADCDALKGLLEKASAGAEADVSPVILSPDADKAHRSEVHNFFKRSFKFLVTDTVEHNDGVQRCIRVRLGSGARGGRGGGGRSGGGRGRKRKNMGGSDWRDDRPFDSRGSTSWPNHVGKFLRFHLCKENKDTQEALGVIGKMLGLQSRSFGFAGTKDKRAVTTQQVTVFKISANRLAALNNRLFGIKVGNFSYVKEGLVLGQLMGNRFTITLRGVVAESEDIIKASVEGLGKNGFINYYGLQRDDIREMREHYKEHGDIDMALRNFPRHLVAEKAILQCLKKCPGTFIVTKVTSGTMLPVPELKNMAVEGDLVYSKEAPPGEATSVDTSEPCDDQINSSDIDLCSETLPEETIQSVKIVDSEDLLKGVYSFEDVVLPLPGSQALFPGNGIADIYHELAKKDGISLTENAHGVKELMTYTDDTASLAETDLDVLSRNKPTKAKEVNETISSAISNAQSHDSKVAGPLDSSMPGSETGLVEEKSVGSSDMLARKLAIKLAFTLPASSYATMAIRELLKTSTSLPNSVVNILGRQEKISIAFNSPNESALRYTMLLGLLPFGAY
uniref:TRUD domain-containing protein n=1 Tax=Oryza barthii TaxID=65489 RepID=A0A0D3G9L4_9ORYZ